ncbi:MAG: prepilin-type N-terminal cleavage/methylation domain-containing protein [Planctomycetes bacterium]|nr:prepilin-type N-terminal cleavage/methylation domain-containing protein [Planctomycetota bacterium]
MRKMNREEGFTLIELLVVIAIITLLMSVLMPALRKARESGKMMVCMSNLKTLTTAWYSYAIDNDDKLCGSWNYNAGNWGDPWDWAWAPWRVGGNAAVSDYFNATQEEKKEGVRKGVLFEYTDDVDCYHCPSDQSAGKNFRSYSLPDSLNGKWGKGKNGNAKWQDMKRLSQLANPSQTYVLVEENDPRGYNINAWVINPNDGKDSTSWSDPIVVWHGNRSGFGFADGHVEAWKWNNETLKLFRDLASWRQPTPQSEDGIYDLQRVLNSWPVPKR